MERKGFRRKTGFTLIELLIVVSIIGIIAVIAIPQMMNAIDRSKQKKTMADMRAVSQAIGMYQIDNGVFPTGNFSSMTAALQPDYMQSVPQSDGWDQPFLYDGQINSYSLSSGGKDGGPVHNSDNNFDKRDFNHPITIVNGVFTAAPSSN
jgi:general secretion pathway protein G